ncbi:MAG: outer membrane lipid asymmetry maintenance protein MlaD [Acidocella sp.]|nr:outer membrane lipid asymmetry maintenance protein MlaD [Acidocella sp.]
MSRKVPEILTGLAVIIVAALFLVYALGRADAINTGGYPLEAQFSSIGGLTVGADVKIGGVVVGHVADESLDPNTYAAKIRMVMDNDIKIPTDSSAAVSSDGLLGGDYVAVSPGGSDNMMAPGQSFQVTQSAINIEDLLGKFIFSMGGSGGTKAGSTPSSGTAPPAGPANPAALSPAPAK